VRMVSSGGHGHFRYPASSPLAFNIIPMSKFDSRFASNSAGSAGATFSVDTVLNNQTFDQSPAYSGNGDQCFRWLSGSLAMNKCMVDWREGPRIAPIETNTFTVDQSFINCVGKTGDHADGFQGIQPGGGVANFTMTNSCVRSYTDGEAAGIYGTDFIGSDAFFWADAIEGSITFDNCLFLGGTRPIAIFADGGTTRISFNNVYIAPSPNGSAIDAYYDIRNINPGVLIVDRWTNVFAATIVGGVIVPGAALPSP
jgi:hypothetical protein